MTPGFQECLSLALKMHAFTSKLKKTHPAQIAHPQPQLLKICLFGEYICKFMNCGFQFFKQLMSLSAPDVQAQPQRHW
jgi:hypothetical protein